MIICMQIQWKRPIAWVVGTSDGTETITGLHKTIQGMTQIGLLFYFIHMARFEQMSATEKLTDQSGLFTV